MDLYKAIQPGEPGTCLVFEHRSTQRHQQSLREKHEAHFTQCHEALNL